MAGEGPVGNKLRNIGDVNTKAKNPWETSLLEPGAEKTTAADRETNSSAQYQNKGGVGKGAKGGENTNS
jgi:hypothetical protein